MTLIRIIIALGPVIPTVISDLEAAAKQIGSDPTAEAKVKDILSTLEKVAGLLVPAV